MFKNDDKILYDVHGLIKRSICIFVHPSMRNLLYQAVSHKFSIFFLFKIGIFQTKIEFILRTS